MSTERPGSVLPRWQEQHQAKGEPVAIRVVVEPVVRPAVPAQAVPAQAVPAQAVPAQAVPVAGQPGDPEGPAWEFVRFCYRRRSVAWPELYDEMCAVAARGDYRGMDYEQLERAGIRFALAALPGLAELVSRVIAEERGRGAHQPPQGGGLVSAGVAAA